MAVITYPHGPLTALATNAWFVSARTSQGIERKMAVARGDGGELFVHDPLWLDAKTFAELDLLGPVTTVFVPSWLHDFDVVKYGERYPRAHVCGLPATLKRLKWPRLEPFAASLAPSCVSVTELPGLRQNECVCEVRHPEGGVTQVYCDALFNMPHGKGLKGWFFKAIGSTGPLHMTPIGRLLLKNRRAFKAYLAQQAERSDIRNIVVAHGRVVTTGVPSLLRGAAERL